MRVNYVGCTPTLPDALAGDHSVGHALYNTLVQRSINIGLWDSLFVIDVCNSEHVCDSPRILISDPSAWQHVLHCVCPGLVYDTNPHKGWAPVRVMTMCTARSRQHVQPQLFVVGGIDIHGVDCLVNVM